MNLALIFSATSATLGVVTAANGAPEASPYTWGNVAIVAGGFIPGIEFSPAKAGLAYARTDIGGAYRWDQAQQKWIPLLDWLGHNDSNLMGVESIAPDPVDPNRVYMAVGTYTQSWASDGAILRSDDRGRHWRRTDLPIKLGGNESGRSMGERLDIDPLQRNVLFFGSRMSGLWRSADYGATWSKVTSLPVQDDPGAIGISFIAFNPQRSDRGRATSNIYIGVTNSPTPIYHSSDGGVTWRPVGGQPAGFMPHQGKIDRRGVLYITYSDHQGPNDISDGAVWKFDTLTGTWADITPVVPKANGVPSFGYAGLALDSHSPGTLMVSTMDRWNGGDDIYRTVDDGKSWISFRKSAVMDDHLSPWLNWGKPNATFGWWIGALAIDPFNSSHVLYGTGATMWSSTDASISSLNPISHWKVGAAGIEETAVNCLASPPEGPFLLSGVSDIGGFRHDNINSSPPSGMSSNPIFGGTTGIDFAQQNPSFVVRVGTGSPGGAYSNDGGNTWTPFSATPPGAQGEGSVAVASDGSTIVWAAKAATPAYSADNGASWQQCGGLGPGAVVAADRSDPHMYYAYDGTSKVLFASRDGGAKFEQLAQGLPDNVKLSASPSQAGDLWLACGYKGLYHSTDGGKSFAKLPQVGTADTLGFGKAALGQSNPALYIAGQIGQVYGVYRSDDGGRDWTRINDDSHQFAWIGQDVTGDPRVYGRVYIATNGRGIIVGQPGQTTIAGAGL